ncbi:hypothetical protein H8E77_01675, partial [bacterium]|nr:hypothetical protein [bacterium]
NVWCGTSGGVSKLSVAKFRESGYDGKFFQNFTTAEGLVNNIVESILQTPSGDVWFATKGGVSRYKDGKFQNFTTKDGLAYSSLLCIAVDREGNLWFGTLSGGASRYDESVKSIPVALHYRRTAKDKQGNLWLSISGIGLGRYDGRILRTFAEEDGLTLDIIGGTFGWEISGWVGTPMVLRDMTAMNFRYLLTKMVC